MNYFLFRLFQEQPFVKATVRNLNVLPPTLYQQLKTESYTVLRFYQENKRKRKSESHNLTLVTIFVTTFIELNCVAVIQFCSFLTISFKEITLCSLV